LSAALRCALAATIPETFAPVFLNRRGKGSALPPATPYSSQSQWVDHKSLSEINIKNLVRPFIKWHLARRWSGRGLTSALEMLDTETIFLLMSLYISLVYGLLCAFFLQLPRRDYFRWGDAKIGRTFCGVFIGVGLALCVTPLLEKRYAAKGDDVTPEDRLPNMLIGGPFVPIPLFIFGWTSPPYVPPQGASWVGPVSSGVPFGFGVVLVYFSANAYLIEALPV
jgi:hypothetical protein